MKKTLLILIALLLLAPEVCRADIKLYGTTNQEYLEVSKKFSPFYKDNIDITIVPTFQEDAFKMGSTRFYSNGFKDIRMRAGNYDNFLGGYTFEFTMNHELCHYNHPLYSEDQCDALSDAMISFVNSLY